MASSSLACLRDSPAEVVLGTQELCALLAARLAAVCTPAELARAGCVNRALLAALAPHWHALCLARAPGAVQALLECARRLPSPQPVSWRRVYAQLVRVERPVVQRDEGPGVEDLIFAAEVRFGGALLYSCTFDPRAGCDVEGGELAIAAGEYEEVQPLLITAGNLWRIVNLNRASTRALVSSRYRRGRRAPTETFTLTLHAVNAADGALARLCPLLDPDDEHSTEVMETTGFLMNTECPESVRLSFNATVRPGISLTVDLIFVPLDFVDRTNPWHTEDGGEDAEVSLYQWLCNVWPSGLLQISEETESHARRFVVMPRFFRLSSGLDEKPAMLRFDRDDDNDISSVQVRRALDSLNWEK